MGSLVSFRYRSLAAASLAAASLAACAPAPAPSQSGGPTNTPSSSSVAPALPSASLSMTPSATPLITAVSATNARGTARLTISVLSTVQGFSDEIEGEGLAILGSGDADIIWSSVVGQTHEIITANELFVQLEPPSGPWLSIPADEWTPTASAGRPLRGISEITDARLDGDEVLDGVATTRYVGSLDFADHADGLGLNGQALQLAEAAGSTRIEVTVWIDERGLIVQVMRTLIGGGDVSASTVTRLSEFGISAIVTPPTAQTPIA